MDTNFEMNMPYSMEAEQAVLGSILRDPKCLDTIHAKGFNDVEYFYRPEHRAIYNAMIKIEAQGQKVEPLLVLEELKASSSFDDASAKNYLVELAESVVTTSNVEVYAGIVKDKYIVRTLISTTNEILSDANTPDIDANTLLDSAESKIYNIRQSRISNDISRLFEVVTGDLYTRLQALNSDDPEVKAQYQGFTTGWTELDNCISGLNKSDLIIIGARPGMGKTSFALNMAANASLMAGKKVIFFSLEMTKEQLAQRVMSTQARIKSTKFRNGNLDADDWDKLAKTTSLLSKCELYFDDTTALTTNEIKSKVRRAKNVDLVVIDYLQLMKSGTRTESRVQEVSEITRNLKLMAKDLNIPVVVLAQLSRNTEGHGQKNHKPMLSDLRESGSIEQDADIVIFLYREDYYNKDEKPADDIEDEEVNVASVDVAKNRHGATESLKFHWDPDYTRFTQIETKYDEF